MGADTAVAELNLSIRAGESRVVELIAGLDSAAVLDAAGCSPLNVAIACGNDTAFDALVDLPGTLDFAPALHDAGDARLMRTIYASQELTDSDLAEQSILEVVHVPPYWGRTPLAEACRRGNRRAMAALIGRGAKLTAKDLLGETPLALAHRSGGVERLAFAVQCCVEKKKRFPVDPGLLRAALADQALYRRVREHGRLNAAARRLVFNLACALLDIDDVRASLDGGFDLNAAVSAESTPVEQAVNSNLLWTHECPGWEELAAGYANMYGHPRGTSIHVPANAGPEVTYAKVKAEVDALNASVRRSEPNPVLVPPAQLEKRLALLSLLRERGLDKSKVRANVGFDLVSSVTATNAPALFDALDAWGLPLGPVRGEKTFETAWAIRHGCFNMVAPLERRGHRLGSLENVPWERVAAFVAWRAAQVRDEPTPMRAAEGGDAAPRAQLIEWELTGESVLRAAIAPDPPTASSPSTVKLTHDNVYGRRLELEFAVRVAGGEWSGAVLASETMHIEGIDVAVEALDELPFGETPWRGQFIAELTLPAGKSTIEIRVTGPRADDCGVLRDWHVTVH